jgi:hypothetical protein
MIKIGRRDLRALARLAHDKKFSQNCGQLGSKGMAELVDVAQTIVLAIIALSQIYTLRTMSAEMAEATRSTGRALGVQSSIRLRVQNLEDEVAQLKRAVGPR